MILNVFSITEIFMGVVSLILVGWAGILALILAIRWRSASTACGEIGSGKPVAPGAAGGCRPAGDSSPELAPFLRNPPELCAGH